jgi:hypothetical protein
MDWPWIVGGVTLFVAVTGVVVWLLVRNSKSLKNVGGKK